MPNCASDNVIVPIAAPDPQEGGIARRKPGRPRVVRPAPTADEYLYHQEQSAARESLIDEDDLLRALEGRADAAEVVHHVVVRLAQETASLRWDRQKAEGDGFIIAEKISARRIDGLAKLAGVVVEARKLGVVGEADPRSPPFQKVEQLWMTSISDCAKETLPSETATVFLDRLMAAMASWRASLNSKPNTSP